MTSRPSRREVPISRVGVWTPTLDTVPSSRARDLAAELEELGYGAVWLPEGSGRDPFVHLALLLSATRSLIGGTGIANIWARDPLATASAARTLAEAFPRRTLIGLGVSHRSLVSDVRGHDYTSPLTNMAKYLDAAQESTYTAVTGQQEPVYLLAALRPKMLRLAAERASGAHPYLVTPEHTSKARQILGDDRMLCPQQAVILDADPWRARALARQYLAPYFSMPNYVNSFRAMGFTEDDLANGGSNEVVDALVVWGNPETVVTRVREHLSAGADHVALHLVAPQRDNLPRLHWQGGLPLTEWRTLGPAIAEIN